VPTTFLANLLVEVGELSMAVKPTSVPETLQVHEYGTLADFSGVQSWSIANLFKMFDDSSMNVFIVQCPPTFTVTEWLQLQRKVKPMLSSLSPNVTPVHPERVDWSRNAHAAKPEQESQGSMRPRVEHDHRRPGFSQNDQSDQ
jgi:hypothetical protein